MLSKIKQFFSNLDLRLYLLSSNNALLDYGDKVYTKEKIKGVNPYSILTVKGVFFSKEETKYHLVDDNNSEMSVNVEKLYPYKGQDLKKQKIYDNVSFTVILAILVAVIAFFSLNPQLSQYRLYNL